MSAHITVPRRWFSHGPAAGQGRRREPGFFTVQAARRAGEPLLAVGIRPM
ncbi:hypothetical protein [Streptomyces sp. NPDC000133]